MGSKVSSLCWLRVIGSDLTAGTQFFAECHGFLPIAPFCIHQLEGAEPRQGDSFSQERPQADLASDDHHAQCQFDTLQTLVRPFFFRNVKSDEMSIFYRSDTRDPNLNIFVNGFTKRDVTMLNPQLRAMGTASDNATTIAPDVHPHSAVCFTRDFYAAPIFPVGDLNCDSWVYVLDLELSDVLNTQKVQFMLVEQTGANNAAVGQETLWPMFGQERCCNQIPNTAIVGALRVSRNFAGTFAQGGSFTCSQYIANPHYTGGQQAAVGGAMNSFIPNTYDTPTQAQGLVRNDPTAL